MAQDWYFRPKVPGEVNREPTQGEFFATDAISDPGTALVREGIQNALDAGVGDNKVTVRIFVSGEQNAPKRRDVDRYFANAWNHVTAPDNGLRKPDVPARSDNCPFLLFEDFGTSGLTGDETAPFRSKTGEKNHFYHFFRAEGQSDKGGSSRGSWGVGKHVFPRASRISALFGLTVRDDDGQRLLMGRAILKSHYVGDDYCQDGYFGEVPRKNALVLPIGDGPLIDEFVDLFSISRRAEPGLSIVVPWPDPEISEQSLIRAVIADYFYPILAGQLDVIVETPSVETVLDKDTLLQEIENYGGDLAEELLPTLKLAMWAQRRPEGEMPKLALQTATWAWGKSLFNATLLKASKEAFLQGENIALRVPVEVRKRDEQPEESFFDVFLVRDTSEKAGKPTFIREGVIISKVDSPRTRGVRALVLAKDQPVAAFLRDAENPSHTEWQHDGSNFKGKYRSGRADLTFVKRAVHEVVQILTDAEREEDVTVLMEFFSIVDDESEDAIITKGKRQRTTRGKETKPPQPLGGRQQRYLVQRVVGGFSVVPTGAGLSSGSSLDIQVAYDIRRGNPLRKYDAADFDLSKRPIEISSAAGLNITERDENKLSVIIEESEFRLEVTGFDQRRDVYVKVTPKDGLQ